MKLAILFLFLSISVSAQSYIRVADKSEYKQYKAHCSKVVSKRLKQDGKAYLLKVNGQYTDSLGNYKLSTRKPKWFAVGKEKQTFNDNEIPISRWIIVNEPIDESPSVKKFYKNWLLPKMEAFIKKLEVEIELQKQAYGSIENFTKELEYRKSELNRVKSYVLN